MNKSFAVSSQELPVILRTIGPEDRDDLRSWKNANREAFFFKGLITAEGQKRWFEGYLSRPEDFMFIVETSGQKNGCMGFRLIEGAADCYNIIGAPQGRGKGALGQGMRLMCSFITAEHARRVGCRVLRDNPAVSWYQKCGYRIAGQEPDYYKMELDAAVFKPCAYQVAERGGGDAEFYSTPIELEGLQPDVVNCLRLDEGLEVLVILAKGELRIIRDLCTHMGAPLSAGNFCAAEATLQCPWHGYFFSAESGEFVRNPNDEMFAPLKGLYASYKPEKKLRYKLQMLPYKIVGGKAYVRRGGVA